MDFFNNQCRACGGATVREGNEFVCKFCGSRWALVAEDSLQVKLQNAWEAQRHSDFDRATELFEEIISGNKKCFEAYWGRALARNGIVFVNDLNEHKKVPTCNNITENRFTTDKDVLAAISSAPSEISADYKKRAEQIEKIRLEWLEKASKEPPYDVFICFKDSDRENGITRTPDSVNAQELYTYLVSQGYNVFFSRVSLRDKISEQYEPYIYNALKTAKVMIVYGEKAEYFNAVWLKNEWTRFRTRIERGEKHKNSLVVAYRNIDVADLPAGLRSRQLIDASEMTFLTSLENHIKKVIELSSQNVHLDRIKVEGGQMSKKASQISVNSVKTREIGAGYIAETDISEKQTLALISTYLSVQDWSSAKGLIDDVLFNNPGCAEAIWYSILTKHKAKNELFLNNILSSKDAQFHDFATVDKLLNCSSKDFASHILDFFYNINAGSDELYAEMLKYILPYAYDKREQNIEQAFKFAQMRGYSNSFDLLLSTLSSDEVDRYISYNLNYAKSVQNKNQKLKHLNYILSVESGNVDALKLRFSIDLAHDHAIEVMISDFEELLKYAKSPEAEVNAAMDILTQNDYDLKKNNVAFMKQLLRYYSGNIDDIKIKLLRFANNLLERDFQSDAGYYFNLILSVDKACAEAFWGLCLVKIGARNENDVLNCSTQLKSCSEFNKYLSLVNQDRQIKCIELAKKQEKLASDSRQNVINKLNEQRKEFKEKIANLEYSIKDEEQSYKENNMDSIKDKRIATISICALCLGILFGSCAVVRYGSDISSDLAKLLWGLMAVSLIVCLSTSWRCIYSLLNKSLGATIAVAYFGIGVTPFFSIIVFFKSNSKLGKAKKEHKKTLKYMNAILEETKNEVYKLDKLARENKFD